MSSSPSRKISFLVSAAIMFLAAAPGLFKLAYNFVNKASSYHHYIEGSIERKGETQKLHLQFIRNGQLSSSGDREYMLREWGEKYQGSRMDLSEIGLPNPGEKLERVIDQMGRVKSALRYSAGHRYYLNWLVFPDHPVPAGKNWNYKYQLLFDVFGKPLRADCEILYTLDKVLAYKKHYAAKILAQGNCKAQDQTTEMQYGFNGKSFFDLDQGREIDYQFNISWLKADGSKNLREIARIELYSILEK